MYTREVFCSLLIPMRDEPNLNYRYIRLEKAGCGSVLLGIRSAACQHFLSLGARKMRTKVRSLGEMRGTNKGRNSSKDQHFLSLNIVTIWTVISNYFLIAWVFHLFWNSISCMTSVHVWLQHPCRRWQDSPFMASHHPLTGGCSVITRRQEVFPWLHPGSIPFPT